MFSTAIRGYAPHLNRPDLKGCVQTVKSKSVKSLVKMFLCCFRSFVTNYIIDVTEK